MYIDATYFGTGVGLVVVGWICGVVASVLFGALRRIERM